MGYRSEVVLAVAPEAAHAWMALLAREPELLRLCQSADDYESSMFCEGDWFMRWCSLKWYDSFPEIHAIMSFVEAMDNDDLSEYGEPDGAIRGGLPVEWSQLFRFIRVGEGHNDIEDRGEGFHDLYINCHVSW
jgi:hypothetical protein